MQIRSNKKYWKMILLIMLFSISLLNAKDGTDIFFVDIDTKSKTTDTISEFTSEDLESSTTVKTLSSFEDDIFDDIFSKIKPVIGNDLKAFGEIIENIQPLGTYINDLSSTYDSALNNLASQISKETESGIKGLKDKPYRRGELNIDGTPSEYALAIRNDEIEVFIQEKKNQLKELTESLDERYSPIIQESFDLYLKLVLDLESREYTTSSLDQSLNITKLRYDGEKGEWHLQANFPGCNFNTLNFVITYRDLSGENIVTLAPGKESEYEAYVKSASIHDSRLTLFSDFFTAKANFRIETLAENGKFLVIPDNYLTITDNSTGKVFKSKILGSDNPQWFELSELKYKELLKRYPWLVESEKVSLKQRGKQERLERKEKVSSTMSRFYLGASIQGEYEIARILTDVAKDTLEIDNNFVAGISLFGRYVSKSLEYGININGGLDLSNFYPKFDVLAGLGWKSQKNEVYGINLGFTDNTNNTLRKNFKFQLFYGSNVNNSESILFEDSKKGGGFRVYVDLYPTFVVALALEFNITKTPVTKAD